MGKALLLAVVIATTMSSYYSLSSNEGLLTANERVADSQYEVLARNAALAGFSKAKQKLAESFAATTFTGNVEGASYQTAVTISGDVARIVSMGSTKNGDVGYSIRAQFENVLSDLPTNPPQFFDFAVLAEDDLDLRGSILSEIAVTGDAANELNSNMHTNGGLATKGNKVSVAGFGTYVTSAYESGGDHDDIFQPGYNPTGMNSTYQTSPIEIPEVDVPAMASAITVDKTTYGSTSIGGIYNLGGTRENPYVWFIDGDLNVATHTTFNGYVLLLVNGNVDLKRDILRGSTSWTGGDESSVGLYVDGHIDLTGNPEVDAQILAGGDVNFIRGTTIVNGTITTNGSLKVAGNPTIRYRPASPGLTTIWQPRLSVTKLNGYNEK